ncbi:IS110 family transposase [Streptomyces sp. NBC_00259]|uniref:IS110 family transposase n=1 Tax=Streptomyces sp. NBC_00259 TaxID=2903643 RepID=UPI002E2A11F6|nr:transposase [Streptomyces sp. NBC_00259]
MPTALLSLTQRVRGLSAILIGVDPHKSSHTAVAVDATGHQVAQRRFTVNAGTFRQLMRWCQQWPERRFAVEGARGLGRMLAQQLAAAGENVVDVPSTLSARARLLATGGDRPSRSTCDVERRSALAALTRASHMAWPSSRPPRSSHPSSPTNDERQGATG